MDVTTDERNVMTDKPYFELRLATFFDAAHRLLDEFYGTGTRLHGHTYHMVVAMRGDTLRDDGMVVDHYAVREIVYQTAKEFHDRCLNDFPAFQDLNTTPEVIAKHIWDLLASRLAEHGVRTLSVEIQEGPNAFVRYEAAIEDAAAA